MLDTTSMPDLNQIKWKRSNLLTLVRPFVRLAVIQIHEQNVFQDLAWILESVGDASILVQLVQILPYVHRALVVIIF